MSTSIFHHVTTALRKHSSWKNGAEAFVSLSRHTQTCKHIQPISIMTVGVVVWKPTVINVTLYQHWLAYIPDSTDNNVIHYMSISLYLNRLTLNHNLKCMTAVGQARKPTTHSEVTLPTCSQNTRSLPN